MDDLIQLNKQIARSALRELSKAQEDYLECVSVCVGRLIPSANALRCFLERKSGTGTQNDLPTVYLNRDYLNFARLIGKDVAAGSVEKLLVMGFDWGQAELFASLTNAERDRIAIGWEGSLINVREDVLGHAGTFHPSARKFHAAALVAVPD